MCTVLVRYLGIGFLGLVFFLFAGCAERVPTTEEVVALATERLDAGDFADAVSLLEERNQHYPGDPAVLETLAFAHTLAGDSTAAAFAYLELHEILPEEPEFLLHAARSLHAGEDLRGAADLYRRYLTYEPEDAAVWRAFAEVGEATGYPNEAITAYTQLHRLTPEAPIAARLGRLFHDARNSAQAEFWYSQALQGDPPPSEALAGLFRMQVEEGRFRDAEQTLAALREHAPESLQDPPLADLQSDLERWRVQQEMAARLVEDLTEFPPSTLPDDSVADAETESEEDAELTPSPGVVRVMDKDRAVREWEADHVVAEEPAEELDEVPEEPATTPPEPEPSPARPTTPTPLELAQAAREAGDLQTAVTHFRESILENDRHARTWFELSEVYWELGDFAWAEATALEAIRREPDNIRYTLQFLRVAQRTLTPDEFLKELQRAYAQFPENPEVVLAMARGYRNIAGNTRNAAFLYDQFLRMAPNHPQADAATRERQSL